MTKRQRTKTAAQPQKVRFVLNGKDWDDCTEEERDQFRAHATRVALDVSMRPIEERYGKPLVAAALRWVLDQWKAEQAGRVKPILTPLMERGIPPFVLARVVETVLAAQEHRDAQEPTAAQPPRYVI